MLFPAMGLAIQAASEPRLNAEAAAFFSFVRAFGQTIGVAISGVIFQNVFHSKLLAVPEWADKAYEYSRDATSVVSVIKALPDGQAKDDLVNTYSESLRMIWITLLAFSAFSMFTTVLIKGYTLIQVHETQQGLVEKGRNASGQKVHVPAEDVEEKSGQATPAS
jgi:hypothetical protein